VRLQTFSQVIEVQTLFGDSNLWSYERGKHRFKEVRRVRARMRSPLYTTVQIAPLVGDTQPAVLVTPATAGAKASVAPASAQSADGGPMPSGDPAGWQMTYEENFNESSLPPGWGAYSGEPGGDSYGWWDPANVTVSNGNLHLGTSYNATLGMYSTGGVSFYGHPQTYGKFLVRLKGDLEPGLEISNIALLWPTAKVWPPEIDFYEDKGGTRSSFVATVHAGPNGDNSIQIARQEEMDATVWHTVGVEWTPTSVTYTLDGWTWAVVPLATMPSGGTWPGQPMFLSLQSQNLGPVQPTGPIETMTVAWVVEYSPTS
jgi:beta-glucanase (GH16 family)